VKNAADRERRTNQKRLGLAAMPVGIEKRLEKAPERKAEKTRGHKGEHGLARRLAEQRPQRSLLARNRARCPPQRRQDREAADERVHHAPRRVPGTRDGDDDLLRKRPGHPEPNGGLPRNVPGVR
jgi:hypothetical protein